MVDTLRTKLIKLAHSNLELRPHLLPILKTAMEFPSQEALDKYLKDHPKSHVKHTVKAPSGGSESQKAPEKEERAPDKAEEKSKETGESGGDLDSKLKQLKGDKNSKVKVDPNSYYNRVTFSVGTSQNPHHVVSELQEVKKTLEDLLSATNAQVEKDKKEGTKGRYAERNTDLQGTLKSKIGEVEQAITSHKKKTTHKVSPAKLKEIKSTQDKASKRFKDTKKEYDDEIYATNKKTIKDVPKLRAFEEKLYDILDEHKKDGKVLEGAGKDFDKDREEHDRQLEDLEEMLHVTRKNAESLTHNAR